MGNWHEYLQTAVTIIGLFIAVWRIDRRAETTDARIDKLETRIDGRIDKLEARMDSRFDKVDVRFDKLDGEVRRLSENYGRHDKAIELLEKKTG